MADDQAEIREFLGDTVRLRPAGPGGDRSGAADPAGMLRAARRVYTAGNGGSASTAQHFACDLAKYVVPDGGRPFDVRCLTDNISLYTAWANDAPREDVFANQLRGLIGTGGRVTGDFRARRQRVFCGLGRAVRLRRSRRPRRLPWSASTAGSCTGNAPVRSWSRSSRRRKRKPSIW